MNKLLILILVLGSYAATARPISAQDQPTQQPSAEDLEKEKAEREKNAYRLLDQVISEAQSLKLTENRVRVQISAADLLWNNNPGRARMLFAMAAEGVAELGRNAPTNNNNRRGGGPPMPDRRSLQLRQELVLTAARHDAQLAYQLLATTKPAQPVTNDPRVRLQLFSDDNLEQTLLGRVAALDPKLAARNAEQMMEKGQFPRTATEVLKQLQKQDPKAADKFADKTVSKLLTTNLLVDNDAAILAQALLTPGPRPADTNTNSATPAVSSSSRAPLLDQNTYVTLLGNVVDLALKAAPQTQNNNARAQAQRGRGRAVAGGGQGQVNFQTELTDAQMEQLGARRLLSGLQVALPIIDQYLPSKGPLVRQKLSEVGLSTNSPLNAAQAFSALQGNPTADTLIQAASMAPPQMQSRLYQQAAFKALDEGNVDRARQIATDYLQDNARDSVMQRIDFREMANRAEGVRFEEIRQMVAKLTSDEEKINLLVTLANGAQKANPKLATQLLEDAKQITTRRATNYDQFELQLRVAHAFATLDPTRSFEILEPGISQLNELLQAAAVLSGFEVNVFRDGEMSIQGGNGLTSMVGRYGQELALLARSDLNRSETLAGRFEFPEPRIVTRLAIVQGLLGSGPTSAPTVNFFPNRAN